jgi:hypothetical protein
VRSSDTPASNKNERDKKGGFFKVFKKIFGKD